MKNQEKVKTKIETQYSNPYVDMDEIRERPYRHRYIHGGFCDTSVRFSMYFPEKEVYEGRFFHYLAPIPGDENAAQNYGWIEDKIGFSLAHGEYYVETNMGAEASGADGDPRIVINSSVAVAEYSRVLAEEFYGSHRVYGYLFGGSGGGFKTISCMENTQGIWDGAVPFVIGTPMTMPNVFMARVHAMRILKNKFPQIVDALDPGGSGNMYEGLNEEETEALKEVTRMGFPPKTWFVWNEIGDGALSLLIYAIYQCDPGYFEDFWNVPGYLGADPDSSVNRDRVVFNTTVEGILLPDSDISSDKETAAVVSRTGVDESWREYKKTYEQPDVHGIRVNNAPDVDAYLQGAQLVFRSGILAGKKLPIEKIEGDIIIPISTPEIDMGSMASLIKPGDEVIIDNSDYIALQTYYRHQVPGSEYTVWDQFRDENGSRSIRSAQFWLAPYWRITVQDLFRQADTMER